jgi:hypothetical protein
MPLLAIGGGTYLATQANTKAASTVNNAVANVQATDSSIAQSGGTGPGTSYLRSLVAQPQTLDPAQQSELQDMRTSVTNQLHGSDFAGSGQTAAAIFKKTDSDFVNTALQQNKQNAISAADKLSGTSTSAAESGANAGLEGAVTGANAATSNAKVIGQALGDVGSLISRQSKLGALS